MSYKKKNHRRSDKPKPKQNLPIVENSQQTINQKPKTMNDTKYSQQEAEYQKKSLKIQEEQKNAQVTANSISTMGVEAAQGETKHTKIGNYINASIGIITFIALLFTIKGINSAKNQFVTSNQPFLNLIEPSIDSFKIGVPMTIRYKLANLGNYPVKILDCKSATHIDTNPFDVDTLEKIATTSDQVNRYISKEYSYNPVYQEPVTMEQYRIDHLFKNHMSIYFGGIYLYQDLITGKKKKYKFLIRFQYYPIQEYVFVRNENVDTN